MSRIKKEQKKKVLLLAPKSIYDPIKPRMPIALLNLATYIKNDYHPIIIDTRIEEDYKRKIENNSDAFCVGITVMTGTQILHALKLSKYIRQKIPTAKIIWGGSHVCMDPKLTIKNKYIDVGVFGEGEQTFLELLKALEKNKSLKTIRGIVYKKDKKIEINSPRKLIDFSSLDFPDLNLIDVNKYGGFEIEIGRGCPHRCGFCTRATEFHRREKKAEDIFMELKRIVNKYKIKEIIFIDDNIFSNKANIIKLCKSIIKSKLKIKWRHVTCRANYIVNFSDNFIKLLKKAGCSEFFIGAESGSQRMLNMINKDITREQVIESVKICKKYNIKACLSFIIGLPYEQKEDIKETLEFIDVLKKIDNNVRVDAIFIYTPFKKTPLFKKALECGFKEPKTLEKWANIYHNVCNLENNPIKPSYLESISYISRFAFFNEEIEKKFVTYSLKIPFEIMKASAKIRWKYKFFNFPLEWIIFRYYLLNKYKNNIRRLLA